MNDEQVKNEFYQWAAGQGIIPHINVANGSVDVIAEWFFKKFSSYKSEVEKKIEGQKVQLIKVKRSDDINKLNQQIGNNSAIDQVLSILRSDN